MNAQAPEDRPIRQWSRTYLYGRSRANRWPLWISWLLATGDSRRIVRELMQIRRAGGDV